MIVFRTYDFENFLASLLIKEKSSRRQALAIRAFNVELARIPSVVSDHKIALMRLKFWVNITSETYHNFLKTKIILNYSTF